MNTGSSISEIIHTMTKNHSDIDPTSSPPSPLGESSSANNAKLYPLVSSSNTRMNNYAGDENDNRQQTQNKQVELSPISNQNANKRQKSPPQVRFNSIMTVRPSLHRNDYTEKERASTWYSSDELYSSQREMAMAAGKVQHDQPLPRNLRNRGLESYSHHKALVREANVYSALYAVLDEQYRQQKRGRKIGTSGIMRAAIRRRYRRESRQASLVALKNARKDELEAIKATATSSSS